MDDNDKKPLSIEQEAVRETPSKRTTEIRKLSFSDGKFQLRVLDIFETIEIEGVVQRQTLEEEYEGLFEPIKKALKADHYKLPDELFALFNPEFDEDLWLLIEWAFQKEGRITSFSEEDESFLFPTYDKGQFKLRHKSNSRLWIRGSEMIFEQESGFGNPTHWEFVLDFAEWPLVLETLGFNELEDLISAIDQGTIDWGLVRNFFELRVMPTIVVKPSFTYPGSSLPAIDTTPDRSFLKPLRFSKKRLDRHNFEVTHLLVGPSDVKVWKETLVSSPRLQTQLLEVHHLTDSALRACLHQLQLADSIEVYNWCRTDEAENLPLLLETARNTSNLCSVEVKQWEKITAELEEVPEEEHFWLEHPPFEFVLNQFGLFNFTPGDYHRAVAASKLDNFSLASGFSNAKEVLRSISSNMLIEPGIATAFKKYSEVLHT
jgi:hypothetical protein